MLCQPIGEEDQEPRESEQGEFGQGACDTGLPPLLLGCACQQSRDQVDVGQADVRAGLQLDEMKRRNRELQERLDAKTFEVQTLQAAGGKHRGTPPSLLFVLSFLAHVNSSTSSVVMSMWVCVLLMWCGRRRHA